MSEEIKNGLYINGGSSYWYKDGLLDRLNGPAIECKNGDKYWFKNGLSHRLDGPAIELADGDKHWFKNGLRHRIGGPAIEYEDDDNEWWLYDFLYSEEQYKLAISNLPLLYWNRFKMWLWI